MGCCRNSLPVCTGDQPERGKRSKRVPDPERNCVHAPESRDNQLRIGMAKDGLSKFVITLRNDPQHPNKINFDVSFLLDPAERCRFESAMISITFGTYAPHEERVPLDILDLSPIKAIRTPTVQRDSDVERPESPSYESSISSSVRGPDSEDDMVPGATQVRGHGIGTPTALWTFVEDKTQVNLRGLIANQELSVTLPHTLTFWMTFWAKAVLESRGPLGWKSKTTLQLGSSEAPYERIIDLSKLERAWVRRLRLLETAIVNCVVRQKSLKFFFFSSARRVIPELFVSWHK